MSAEDIYEQYEDKIDPSDLDEMVHNCKADEAAAINNGGLQDQIEYLLQSYTDAELRAALDALLRSEQ